MRLPDYIPKSKKSKPTRKVINEAIYMLAKFGVPVECLTERKRERMAMAFLAVADVANNKGWSKTKGEGESIRALKTREIIEYINRHFEEKISSGSYDDIRRGDLRLLLQAGIIIQSNPNAAANDPTRGYVLSSEYSALICRFGNENWNKDVEKFMSHRIALAEELAQRRIIETVQVVLPNGLALNFSSGRHNQLQREIIESFLPRFGHGAEVLYVGDAAKNFCL
jgi:type II restriction enzyme